MSECSCPPRHEGDPTVECAPKGCQNENDCAKGAFCDFERSEQIADAVASSLLVKEEKEEEEKQKKEEDASTEEEGSGEQDEEEDAQMEETEEQKEARIKKEEEEREEEKERLKEKIASKGECKCPAEFVGNPYIQGCREGEG